MTKQSAAVLKTYFETGDKPNQTQFSDFIDSYQNLTDDNLIIGSEIGISGVNAATQGTAYQLTKYYSSVDTVANVTYGVKAPKAVLIKSFLVNSNGVADLLIFPTTGDSFKNEAPNSPITLPKGFSYLFVSLSSTILGWIQLPNSIPATVNNAVWTEWLSSSTITIGAITTAPTKATTKQNDYTRYRYLNKETEVIMVYSATSGAGAADGSGNYLFTLPSGFSFDTTYHPLYTGTEIDNVGLYAVGRIPAGLCNSLLAYTGIAYIIPYNATKFRIIIEGPNYPKDYIGSGRFPLGNNNIITSLQFKFMRT